MATHPMGQARPTGPRGQILATLAQLPAGTCRDDGLTAAELGERLDLHPTTIRFHVRRLRAAGLIRQHDTRREGAGRPSRKYALIPSTPLTAAALESVDSRTKGAAFDANALNRTNTSPAATDSPASPHGLLAGVLVRSAGPDGLSPAQAGRAWAHEHVTAGPEVTWPEATTRVAGLLADWGYDVAFQGPAVNDPDVEVTFSGCPFEALARTDPQVVCAVHQGLLEGSLQSLGHEGSQVRLFPFSTPTSCHARLTPTTDEGAPCGAGTC